MKARYFKDGKKILLLIPFLIVVMLTSCVFVINAAAVSDRTLQSNAAGIKDFNAAAKVEASIARKCNGDAHRMSALSRSGR